MLMGKTYWKGVVLPSVLHGIGLMNPNGDLINKLQSMEHGVYRKILRARENTVKEVLRGEVGVSDTETRFIQSRLLLAKSIWESTNKWVKDIIIKIRNDNNNPWNRVLNGYLRKVGIQFEDLILMDKKEIKKKVHEYDYTKWKEGIDRKTSVDIYKKFKYKIKEEKCYDNRESSKVLFQARANCMTINYRHRHIEGKDTTCDLCGNGAEDLEHFLLKCESLENERDMDIINRNKDENKNDWMGKILWCEKDLERVKEMLGYMWKKRVKIRKEKGLSPE